MVKRKLRLGVSAGFLIGSLAVPAAAQDLDAGKSPQQLFSANCSACHSSPRGLVKNAISLSSFLRQHYTSNAATASALAAYVASAGAADPRETARAQREKEAAARRGNEPRQDAAAPAEPREEPAARRNERATAAREERGRRDLNAGPQGLVAAPRRARQSAPAELGSDPRRVEISAAPVIVPPPHGPREPLRVQPPRRPASGAADTVSRPATPATQPVPSRPVSTPAARQQVAPPTASPVVPPAAVSSPAAAPEATNPRPSTPSAANPPPSSSVPAPVTPTEAPSASGPATPPPAQQPPATTPSSSSAAPSPSSPSTLSPSASSVAISPPRSREPSELAPLAAPAAAPVDAASSQALPSSASSVSAPTPAIAADAPSAAITSESVSVASPAIEVGVSPSRSVPTPSVPAPQTASEPRAAPSPAPAAQPSLSGTPAQEPRPRRGELQPQGPADETRSPGPASLFDATPPTGSVPPQPESSAVTLGSVIAALPSRDDPEAGQRAAAVAPQPVTLPAPQGTFTASQFAPAWPIPRPRTDARALPSDPRAVARPVAGNANVTRYGDAGAPVLAPAPVSTPSSVAAAPVQVPPRPSTEPRTAGPVTPRQLLPFGPDVVTDARPPEVVSSRQREALPSSAEEAAAAPNTATTALSSDQPVFSVPLP